MTQLTPITRSLFQEIEAAIDKAQHLLDIRRADALAGGNTALARELLDAVQALREDVVFLRKAEQMFWASDRDVGGQTAVLLWAVSRTRAGLANLDHPQTSLRGAAQILDMLCRLGRLLS